MNDKAVYRTAPATPGLLSIIIIISYNDQTNYWSQEWKKYGYTAIKSILEDF